MNKYKISEEEFHKVSLTRLANNPSSQSRYSGARLSAEELKMRMDEPLKLFKGKLNAVVSLIFGEGDDSALDHMPTGIKEGHTLAQMIKDVVSTSAEFAGYLSVGEKTLLKKLEEIDKAFEDINNALKGKVDKKTYEDAIKQCLKRIDGDEGVEYAYAQLNGEGRLKPMSVKPEAGSVALRGEGGRLKAGTPRDDDDVVTKGYADKTHYGASQIFASALKGSASGEAVALKDVSPLEHNLKVKISGVDNPESVKITAQGKNLFDVSKIQTSATVINNNDGTILVKGSGQSTGRRFGELCPNLKVGDTFTISLRITNAVQDTKEVSYIYVGDPCKATLTSRKSYTVTEDMLNGTVFLYKTDYANIDKVTEGVVSEIQVEIGAESEYDPYKEPTEYAYGEEIKSIYPSTTLMTDTEGAVISVEYNRDINKAFEELMNLILSLGGNLYV